MNGHEQIKAALAIYDSLSQAEQARIDQHLQSCPVCRANLDVYRKMDSTLDKLVDPKPTAQLRPEFYARLEGERPKQNGFLQSFLPFVSHLSGNLAQLGAVAVLVLIVFSMWLSLRSRPEPSVVVPTATAVSPQPTATPTLENSPTPAPLPITPTPAPPVWSITLQSALSGQLNVVRTVAIGADGQFITAYGSSFFTLVWKQMDGGSQYQQIMQQEVAYSAAINSLSLSSLGYLAVGGADGLDGLVSVLNPDNGKEVYALPTAVPPVESVAFSNSGNVIAIGTDHALREQHRAVYLWFLDYSDRLYELDFEGDSAIGLAFSPDDSLIAAVSTQSVNLWQALSNEFIRALTAEEEDAPVFSSLAFAPNGQTIAAGTRQGIVYLWRVADGQLLERLDAGTASIQSLAFSADGSQIATVSSFGQITVWQLGDSGPELLFSGQTAERVGLATDVIFMDKGVLAAVGLSDGQVQLWRAAPDKDE